MNRKWAVAEPRTTREALIAEVLGDMDTLVQRVEALQRAIDEADARLSRTVARLDQATDRYRQTVTAFADQAKSEVQEYVQTVAHEAGTKAMEEQRQAMFTAARFAFRSEVAGKAATLSETLMQMAREFRHARRSRFVEFGVTALLSSLMTAALVALMLAMAR
jgi:ABC-type transporter Mla subunit MlaD